MDMDWKHWAKRRPLAFPLPGDAHQNCVKAPPATTITYDIEHGGGLHAVLSPELLAFSLQINPAGHLAQDYARLQRGSRVTGEPFRN
jgi:hypothetical protein